MALVTTVPTADVQADTTKQKNAALQQQFSAAVDQHATPIVDAAAKANEDAYKSLSKGVDDGLSSVPVNADGQADPLAQMPEGESPYSFAAFSKAFDDHAAKAQAPAPGPTPTATPTPATPSQREDRPGAAPGPGGSRGIQQDVGGLVPAQYNDQTLSAGAANAACGPAAAVAFARANGRNPTLAEATQLAQSVGWTAGGGMAGAASEQALMNKMGVSTRLESTPNWQAIQQDASSGNPVAISTPQHYFVVDGYDPQKGAYHVGNSGTAVQVFGGSPWMTANQIASAGRGINGVLYADHPLSPTPSTAEQPTPAPDPTEHQMGGELDAAADGGGDTPPVQAALNLLDGASSAATPVAHPVTAYTKNGPVDATAYTAAGAVTPVSYSPAAPTPADVSASPPAQQAPATPAAATSLPVAGMPQAAASDEPPIATDTAPHDSLPPTGAEPPAPHEGEADTADRQATAKAATEPVAQYNQRTPGGLGTFEQVTKNASGNYDTQPAAQPSPNQQMVYDAVEAATKGFTTPDVGAPLLAGSTEGAQSADQSAQPQPATAGTSDTAQALKDASQAYLDDPSAANQAAYQAASHADNAAKGLHPDGSAPTPGAIAGPPAPKSATDTQAGDNPILGFILHPDQHVPGFLQPVVSKVEDLAKTLDADIATVAKNVWDSTPDSTKQMISAAANAASQASAHAEGFDSPEAARAAQQATGTGSLTRAALNALSLLPGGKLLDSLGGSAADAGAEAVASAGARAAAKVAEPVATTAAEPVAAGAADNAAEAAGAKLATTLGQVPADSAAQQAQDTISRLVDRSVAATNDSQFRTLQRQVAGLPEDQQNAFAQALEARIKGEPAGAGAAAADDLTGKLETSAAEAPKPTPEPEPATASMGPGTAHPSDVGSARPNTGDTKLDDALRSLQDNYLTRFADSTNPDQLANRAAHARESLKEAQGQILDSLHGVSAKDAADVGEILTGKSVPGASDAAFAAANKVEAVRQVVNNIAERYSAGGLSDVKTTMQGINEDAIPSLLKVGKNAPEGVRGPGGTASQRLVKDIMDWHEMMTGERPTVISPKELQQFIDERGLKGVQVVNDPGVLAAKYVSSAMTPMNDLQFAERLKALAADDGGASVSNSKGEGMVKVPNVPRSLAKALTGDSDAQVFATPAARDAIVRYSGKDWAAGIAEDHPKVAAALSAIFDKPKNLMLQAFTMNPMVHISRLAHEAAAIPDATARGAAAAKSMTASAAERMAAVRDGLHLPTSRAVAGKLAQALDAGTDIPMLKTGHAVLDATLGRLSEANHRLTMQTFAQDVQMAIYSGLKAKGMPGEAAAKVANTMTGQLANTDFGPITNWVRAHIASTPSWSTSRVELLKTAIPGLGTKGAYLKGLTPEEQRMVIGTIRRVEATKAAEFAVETGMVQQLMAGHFLPTAAQIKAGHVLDVDTGHKDDKGQPVYSRNMNFEEMSVLPRAAAKDQMQEMTPLQRGEKLGKNFLALASGRLSSGITEPLNLATSLHDQKLHPYLGSSASATPADLLTEKAPYVPGRGNLPLGPALAGDLAGIQEMPTYGKAALPPKYYASTAEDRQKGALVSDPERQQQIDKAVAAYRMWETASNAGDKTAAAKLKPDAATFKLGATYSTPKALNVAYSAASRTGRIGAAVDKVTPKGPLSFLGV